MIRIVCSTILLTVLVGCGSDRDKSDSAGVGPTDVASSTESSPSAAATREAKQLSKTKLKGVLPALDDMPAGYSPSKDDSENDETSKELLCGADFKGDKGRTARASVDYAAEEGLSAQQMTFAVSQYDSARRVDSQLQQFADVVGKCDTFTLDGNTYTLTPMSAGRIGDRTVAVKMTAKSGGFDVTLNLIVVGSGPGLVTSLSASAGVTGQTVRDLVRLTAQTVDRYDSAVKIP